MQKEKHILQEPDPNYENAETALLREALKRSYKERFLTLTRFYKMQKTLNKAKITYRNAPDSK